MQNVDLETLNTLDKRFILGFDAALKIALSSLDDIENEEMVCSVRCFKNASDDIKSYIKEYISNDCQSYREHLIKLMIKMNDEV